MIDRLFARLSWHQRQYLEGFAIILIAVVAVLSLWIAPPIGAAILVVAVFVTDGVLPLLGMALIALIVMALLR